MSENPQYDLALEDAEKRARMGEPDYKAMWEDMKEYVLNNGGEFEFTERTLSDIERRHGVKAEEEA